MLFGKPGLLILAVIILALSIYLNRSYDHIYSYDQKPDIVRSALQRNYILEGGKGEKSIKYLALGDSLTYGYGAKSYKGTFPYVLGQKLLDKYKKVEVLNLAVSGSVAEDVLSGQLPQALEEKPDFVTIFIGTNDVHDFTDKEKFRASLEIITDKLKITGAKIILINIPYLGTDSLILFPYNKLMDARIKEFNLILKDLADKKGIEYFDLYTPTKEYSVKNPDFYSKDQFHPSEKGYIFWGDLISAD